MRKILSLILVLVVAFSAAVVCYAALINDDGVDVTIRLL